MTNGDVFVWQNVWPTIAAALRVEPGEPEPHSLSQTLPGKQEVWDRIVARHRLRPIGLAALLGQSDQYADFCFAYGAERPPAPALVSTIELRKTGIHDCIDTEDMFVQLIHSTQARLAAVEHGSSSGSRITLLAPEVVEPILDRRQPEGSRYRS